MKDLRKNPAVKEGGGGGTQGVLGRTDAKG